MQQEVSKTVLQRTNIRRYEFKYLVPSAIFPALQGDIHSFLPHDDYSASSPDKFYHVRTLYFDTPSLQHYREKSEGLEKKTKYRLRCYHDQDEKQQPIFLEIKHKRNMLVFKRRFVLSSSEASQLCDDSRWGSHGPLELPVGERNVASTQFLWAIRRRELRPFLLLTYERQAWQDPQQNEYFRITTDRYIETNLGECLFPAEVSKNTVLPQTTVLELKFDRAVPFWTQALLRKYGLERQACSKYYLAGQALGVEGYVTSNFIGRNTWTRLQTF